MDQIGLRIDLHGIRRIVKVQSNHGVEPGSVGDLTSHRKLGALDEGIGCQLKAVRVLTGQLVVPGADIFVQRIGPVHPLVVVHGLFPVSAPLVDRAQIVYRFHIPGIDGQRLLVLTNRFGEVLFSQEEISQLVADQVGVFAEPVHASDQAVFVQPH